MNVSVSRSSAQRGRQMAARATCRRNCQVRPSSSDQSAGDLFEMATEEIEMDSGDAKVNVKVPRRVLHFSDGTIEEYSDDEDAGPQPSANDTAVVDTSSMAWGRWLSYKASQTGSSTLAVCDYLGESLASFFGITGPKYFSELEEFRRTEAERAEAQKEAEGWTPKPDVVATQQPLNNNDGPAK